MARYVIDVPGLAQLRIDYAALAVRLKTAEDLIAMLLALFEAGGVPTIPTPSPSANVAAYWSTMQ